MKWTSIVGARPQFIKLAPLCEAIAAWNDAHPGRAITHRIIHTGQHYDAQMSDVFFRHLALPVPDAVLGIGSGSHAEQTGRMLTGIESVLTGERPDAVLVYGDTNSTLAGALSAAKLALPVAHVEAGLRSFRRTMPEEINRIVADHLATWFFCPGAHARALLAKEGMTDGVHVSGDVMYDVLLKALDSDAYRSVVLPDGLAGAPYLLLTIHRAENTADAESLLALLDAVDALSHTWPVFFPVHPRTRLLLDRAGWLPRSSQMYLHEPVSYLEMLALTQHAAAVLTDSGGLQKEAYWLGVPCLTLREETEWVELVESGWNRLVGFAPGDLGGQVERALAEKPGRHVPLLYGDGHAAEYIVRHLAGG